MEIINSAVDYVIGLETATIIWTIAGTFVTALVLVALDGDPEEYLSKLFSHIPGILPAMFAHAIFWLGWFDDFELFFGASDAWVKWAKTIGQPSPNFFQIVFVMVLILLGIPIGIIAFLAAIGLGVVAVGATIFAAPDMFWFLFILVQVLGRAVWNIVRFVALVARAPLVWIKEAFMFFTRPKSVRDMRRAVKSAKKPLESIKVAKNILNAETNKVLKKQRLSAIERVKVRLHTAHLDRFTDSLSSMKAKKNFTQAASRTARAVGEHAVNNHRERRDNNK